MNWLTELAQSVQQWVGEDSAEPAPDSVDSGVWFNLALSAALAKHCGGQAPEPETVLRWRQTCLAFFDQQVAPTITDHELYSQRRQLLEHTFEQLQCLAGAPAGALQPAAEPEGILTSLTRQLPPQRAMELYHKIAPVFVYQILSSLKHPPSVRCVRQLVDHLCSEAVQQKLRRCPHVREGILAELRDFLGHSEVQYDFSLQDLQAHLEDCGAMSDLIAMANCITLASTKAS